MSGVPSIFASSDEITESAASATTPNYSVLPLDTGDEAFVRKEDPSKTNKRTRKHNEKGAALSKKQMTIPPQEPKLSVGSVFGRLAENCVTEEELKRWKAHTQEEQRTAIIRTEDDLDSYSSRIQGLESEIDSLKNDNKVLKQKLRDEKSSMDSSLSAFQLEKARLDQLIKDKDTALKSLEETNRKLTLEIEEMKVDRANNWAVEKEKIKEAAFEDGFRSAVKTFMAVDPEYNWAEKFGKEVAKWMKEFSVMEAAGIAERKALLEAEKERDKARLQNPNAEDDASSEKTVDVFKLFCLKN